jgi:hypothetical protein
MKREGLAESPAGRWTRPEDYLGALARKRSFRHRWRRSGQGEREVARLMLSTVPFVALLSLLGILAVAIMVTAFPGSQPQVKAAELPQSEQGVAQKGWFEDAQREFHR